MVAATYDGAMARVFAALVAPANAAADKVALIQGQWSVRLLLCAFLLLHTAFPAGAQQQEQATIQFQLPPLWCDGIKQDGGMLFLENYVDKPLPASIYILNSVLWVDGIFVVGPVPPNFPPTTATIGNIRGNIPLTVDPQQQYSTETGWPFGNGNPVYQPRYYKMFAYRRIEDPENAVSYPPKATGSFPAVPDPGVFTLPMRYSAGDGVANSPECLGGDGVNPLQVWTQVNIVSPVLGGDLKDLPVPSTFFEQKVSLTGSSTAGTGSSVRLIFPGPPQATTKFRAHIFHRGGALGISQVQHASVCLQSGNTSNCQGLPVQLKFGSQNNYYLISGDAAWTNTIPFAVPAGQNVLVTVSSFAPGATNYWSLNTISGNGMWYSTIDAWNTASMSIPAFYPNFTRTVDSVQMR